MGKRAWEFFKSETVLCVAAVCAVITMFLVPPDGAYRDYVDVRVLCLLLSLMAVVAGFQSCGVFQVLSARLLSRGGGRSLGIALVLLPFFASMVVTNDVSLITFVPFTLLVLEQLGCQSRAVGVLVLQTMAANLGSMTTPVGNPQNLYLYAAYNLSTGAFFATMLPLTALSLVGLTAAAAFALPRDLPRPELPQSALENPKKLALYLVLFVLCLFTVFRILPYGILTAVVLLALAIAEPKLLKKLDISLLATFVCFFVVSGNLGRMDAVRTVLEALLRRSTMGTAALASQVISNVPAAVLLSAFTDDGLGLLRGTNIGGLGTPVASLASLITLKYYFKWPWARRGRYLAVFLGANFLGLALLLAAAHALA